MTIHSEGRSNGKAEAYLKIVSIFVSQIPAAITITDVYRLSLYQPSIYYGKEPFLLFPFMCALFSIWLVMRDHRAMYFVFLLFCILAIAVYWIYDSAPLSSPLHPINWILSYCAFALVIAVATRLVAEIVGIK